VPRNCATVEIGWEGMASKQSMGGGDDKLLFFLLFFLLFWLYFALCCAFGFSLRFWFCVGILLLYMLFSLVIGEKKI
jgi:hypothetical protein